MMKPPNIQPVYPLREESAAEKQLIHIEPNVNGKAKQGPIIIFNTETTDPRSALYQISKAHDVDDFLKQLSTLGDTLFREDFDVVILHEESRKRYFDNSFSKVAQFSRASVADPFNIDFTEGTKKHIESENRPIIWVGQCTQPNFLKAFETFRASFVGFANELSNTQMYNCHKLNLFNVGRPISNETPDIKNTIKEVMFNQAAINKEVTFYSRLLAEDERLSKMDIIYWIDYVYLFGVKDLIPLYDHMNPVMYRNWDVYVLLWSVFFVVLFVWYKVISTCKRTCCGGSKVKQA